MTLLDKAKEFRKEFEASKKVARKYVLASEIPVDELQDLIGLYDEWKPSLSVKVGERYKHVDRLYEVIQAHSTQADWTPDKVPALFKEVTPSQDETGTEIIPEWKQPTGGHDAYKKGDKVTFENKVYESLIDGNSWSPTQHPSSWKEV